MSESWFLGLSYVFAPATRYLPLNFPECLCPLMVMTAVVAHCVIQIRGLAVIMICQTGDEYYYSPSNMINLPGYQSPHAWKTGFVGRRVRSLIQHHSWPRPRRVRRRPSPMVSAAGASRSWFHAQSTPCPGFAEYLESVAQL